MSINRHFNASNKIIAVDELQGKTGSPADSQNDKKVQLDLLNAYSDWQDDSGKLYINEMTLKTLFSKTAESLRGCESLFQDREKDLTGLQQTMDTCEDHTIEAKAGKLAPIPDVEARRAIARRILEN